MDCHFQDLPLMSLIVPRKSGKSRKCENDSPFEITHKIKSSPPNLMILVLSIMRKRCYIQQGEKNIILD